VSSPAQAAAVVATRLLPSHAPPIRAHIAALRAALTERLSTVAGLPQQAGGPFLLYRIEEATTLLAALRARGVLVRHAASFGLPEHIRIGVRNEPDQQSLLRIWKAEGHESRLG
jgi:histidinol-phosphate aminotransferase